MPLDYRSNGPKTDYRKTFSNEYDQIQCHGCRALQPLYTELRRNKTGDLGCVQIHESYRELALCAAKCAACQIFQRGLLLQQITVEDSEALEDDDSPIYATLIGQGEESKLEISVGIPCVSTSKVATIQCNASEDQSTHLNGVADGAHWKQLQTWMESCDDKHSCRNNRWSNRNPSWLMKILPNNRCQLVRGSEAAGGGLVDYVALSYCWGSPAATDAKVPGGWQRVQRAHTETSEDGLPVTERLRPFSRTHFPQTIRDAIEICEQLSLEYIWIDQVCIVSEWNAEAGRMHEVYGNAYFTLFACSADKAIDSLCTYREAWHYPVRACRLYGYWLANCDTTLAELRLRNPLSNRGWILQEERLSPRILYWTAQRAYWSCCKGTAMEAKQSKVRPTAKPEGTNQSRPQDFMLLTRSGDTDQMHEEWLELVASYTRRSLSEQGKEKDRFRAISGLAVRYLSAGNSDAPHKNEYLAGLWRHDFARHLSWRVIRAIRPDQNLRSVAPTWSWASLPLCTEVDLRAPCEACEHFSLLEVSRIQPRDTERDIVDRGPSFRSVRVRGRLRRLVKPDSIIVPWEAVMPEINGIERFDMPLDPSHSVHARNSDGRLLIYEAHKAEVICQLDYLEPEAVNDEKASISVDENAEKALFCLEVGKTSMLLLEEVEHGEHRYRRVGVGLGYRKNFFDGHEVREVVLE